MHCSKCGAAHKGKNSVCDECARVLGNMPSKNVFTSNAGSFTAGQTPPAVTSPWPAANPQPAVTPRPAANPQPALTPQSAANPQPAASLQAAAALPGSWAEAFHRYHAVPLRLRGKPVKTAWLLAGGVASVAAIALGAYVWGMSTWWFILLFPSLVSVQIGNDLKRKRYTRVLSLCNLEANRAGEVFYTEIGGQCPVCGGEVKFREIGPKRQKETTAVCSVNGRHRWKFDPGVLDEL
ncbi:hypothetical protein [Achromobacter anxifer]|uniref:hypothetical protein n=1 Tax=Achromobacter anxifer TaxID=1287737 RepID=UPI0023F902F3|nr:hypothetical protein [Achromobacter anxifer]MDF8364612.1 hypothetical protein [Achromobacter anxifer]